MRRPFLVEEIMLLGSSGEVRGLIWIDSVSGTIERLECRSFHFRRDDTDHPTTLSGRQRSVASDIAERTLHSQRDLLFTDACLSVSAEAHSPPGSSSKSTAILASYLQTPRETQAESEPIPLEADRHQARIAESG
ncbi:MAG: hypothetical protein ACR2NZ_15230 [Rubripirellula sp.]